MEMQEDEMRRIETRWKSDMDAKVDRLCHFADTYEAYLKLCLKREVDKDHLRQAIIEKLVDRGLWAGLVVLALAMWQYAKEHLK